MDSTIVGMFDSHSDAMQARDALLAAGFASSQVRMQGDDSSTLTGSTTGTTTMPVHDDHGSGGIGGFFRSLFGMDERDEYVGAYSEGVRRGGAVLAVDVRDDDEITRAEDIMNRYGAVDVDERAAQWRQEGWSHESSTYGTTSPGLMPDSSLTGTGTTAGTTAGLAAGATMGTAATRQSTTTDTTMAAGETASIPVVQEELRIGKRAVQRGGLRVFSRLVETPVEETVALREEHATIQRHAVDRPATEADLATLRDGVIEVRETGEEVVAQKVARVTEEIQVGKQVTERQETVRDTVRHTDVRVEEVGDHAMANRLETDRLETDRSDRTVGERIKDALDPTDNKRNKPR